MPVITEAERKGNPPSKATTNKAADAAAAKSDAKETTTVKPFRQDGISAHEDREVGTVNVVHGALDRAEQRVAAGRDLYPKSEQPTRIVVDADGKVIPEGAATSGGTVLTGAEADAYIAAHGGAKAAAAPEAKRGKKAANKQRAKAANKGASRKKARRR